MDRLRERVTLALVGVFLAALVFDAVDCAVLGNRYEVPAMLAGVVGTAVGGLYAPELLRRLKNGNGSSSNGNGEGKKEG